MRAADRDRIRRAVEEAELVTSAEVVVSIAPLFWGRVERAAELAFARLGVARTRERNGVLFFIVPSRRQFVLRADAGIHERAGQAVWDELTVEISARLARGDLADAIVDSVRLVGRRLGAIAPHDPTRAENELADAPRYRSLR